VLHACAARFDVTGNLENSLDFGRTKQGLDSNSTNDSPTKQTFSILDWKNKIPPHSFLEALIARPFLLFSLCMTSALTPFRKKTKNIYFKML